MEEMVKQKKQLNRKYGLTEKSLNRKIGYMERLVN